VNEMRSLLNTPSVECTFCDSLSEIQQGKPTIFLKLTDNATKHADTPVSRRKSLKADFWQMKPCVIIYNHEAD